jgi:hypothetical protein
MVLVFENINQVSTHGLFSECLMVQAKIVDVLQLAKVVTHFNDIFMAQTPVMAQL